MRVAGNLILKGVLVRRYPFDSNVVDQIQLRVVRIRAKWFVYEPDGSHTNHLMIAGRDCERAPVSA
jgi:hypothetical protein